MVEPYCVGMNYLLMPEIPDLFGSAVYNIDVYSVFLSLLAAVL